MANTPYYTKAEIQAIQRKPNSVFSDFDIVVFGDSISMLSSNWTHTFNTIVMPKKLTNMAISGQKIAWREGTIETTNPPTDGHDNNVLWNSIKKWESLNPSATPQAIIIAEGTNDISQGSVLGSYTDAFAQDLASTDQMTMANALRNALQYLIVNYPNTKIFYCTPIQSKTGGRNYENLSQVRDINTAICNRLNIQVINCLNESGICDEYEPVGASGRYLYDGVHPNSVGAELQGKYISNQFINKYF